MGAAISLGRGPRLFVAQARYAISPCCPTGGLRTLSQLWPAAELQPLSTAANQISTSYATCQTWLAGRQRRASAQPSFQQFATQEGPAHCGYS